MGLGTMGPAEQRGHMRTYTVRDVVGSGVDTRLVVDRVLHGDGGHGPGGDWAARVAGPFDEFERAGEVKLRTESSGVYELTSDQLALWKRAAEPLRKDWFDTVRKIGVNPVTAMDSLRDQLVRQNAAY